MKSDLNKLKCAIEVVEVFCVLTNGGGVCSADSRHVIRADREAVESIWSAVVLLGQVAGFDVWSSHN